jgi:D-glycero-D-manno-heptose 1,7-bisphosphate phosphatase
MAPSEPNMSAREDRNGQNGRLESKSAIEPGGKAQGKAVFLDKDGTLIDDLPYNVEPVRIRLTHRAVDALQLLRRHGFRLFVISNQSGVARGLFDESALQPVWQRLRDLLGAEARIDGFYHCPHHPHASLPQYALACDCRKPAPGLLLRAAREHDIDLAASWMVGDILNDVEAGRRAGCRSILIDNGNETEWLLSVERIPHACARDLYEAALLIVQGEQDAQMSAGGQGVQLERAI